MSETLDQFNIPAKELRRTYTINSEGLFALASAAVYIEVESGKIHQQAGRWVKDHSGRLLGKYYAEHVGVIGVDHDTLDWTTYYVSPNGENFDIRIERG